MHLTKALVQFTIHNKYIEELMTASQLLLPHFLVGSTVFVAAVRVVVVSAFFLLLQSLDLLWWFRANKHNLLLFLEIDQFGSLKVFQYN